MVYVLNKLHHSLILGVDFLHNTQANLNFFTNTVELTDNPGISCITKLDTKAGIARTKKAITIPQRSEMLISVVVSRQQNGSEVLLEPLQSLGSQNLSGAKCLVQVKNGRAFFKLLNPTHKDIFLRTNREVAKVSCIQNSNIQSLDENYSKSHDITISNVKK